MPCDTIQKVTLELKKANKVTLQQSLESQGYNVSVTRTGLVFSHKNDYYNRGSWDEKTGQLIARSEQDGNLIKQNYSATIVKNQAKKFGWQVKVKEEVKV